MQSAGPAGFDKRLVTRAIKAWEKFAALTNENFPRMNVLDSRAIRAWLHGSRQAEVLRLTRQVIHSVDRIGAAAWRMVAICHSSRNPEQRMECCGWGDTRSPARALFWPFGVARGSD